MQQDPGPESLSHVQHVHLMHLGESLPDKEILASSVIFLYPFSFGLKMISKESGSKSWSLLIDVFVHTKLTEVTKT